MQDSAGCILTAFISLTNIAIVKTDYFFYKSAERNKKLNKALEATGTENLVLSFACVLCCMLITQGGVVI